MAASPLLGDLGFLAWNVGKATPSSYPSYLLPRNDTGIPSSPTPLPLSPHHAVAAEAVAVQDPSNAEFALSPCAVEADAGKTPSWLMRPVERAFLATFPSFAHHHDSSEMGIISIYRDVEYTETCPVLRAFRTMIWSLSGTETLPSQLVRASRDLCGYGTSGVFLLEKMGDKFE